MRSESVTHPLMISGTLFPHLWLALGIRVCTFERTTKGIPRCRPACYERMRLCRTVDLFGKAAYRANSFFANRVAPETMGGRHGISAEHHVLRVIFARRSPVNPEHTRSILNVRDLVTYCNNMRQVHGWKITCTSEFMANLTLRQTISRVRKHDVLVCMNGGDCAHGLHLPHGRTVVETVPYGFERAPDPWLNLYRSRMVPVLKHRRVVLCDNNRTSTRHYVDAWNQPGILPPMRFLEVIRSIVKNTPKRFFPC